jgi:hypothetical protein
MPDEKITFNDALVVVHASLFGNVQIEVACRNYRATLTPQQFAELVYPAIDAKAKESDAPASS